MAVSVLSAQINVTAPNVNSTTNQVTQGLNRVTSAADRSNQTLTDTGRVLQDLPYGFNSIANNLNPLFESFRRLQAQTGSTALALRALGSLLIGAGGIGFALSAVTSILTFATVGFGAWTRGLSGSSSSVKNLKDETKSLSEVIRDISDDVAKQATEATKLVAALNSGTLSYEQRKTALQSLKRVNEDYFGQLREENGVIVGLQNAYDLYIKKLKEIAIAKSIQTQLTKLFDQKLELQLSINPKFISANTQKTVEELGRLRNKLNELGGPVDLKNFQIGNKNLQERVQLQTRINKLQRGDNVFFQEGTLKETNDQIGAINLKIAALSDLLQEVGQFDITPAATKAPKNALALTEAFKTAIVPTEAIKIPVEPEIIPRATPEQIAALSALFKGFKTPDLNLTSDQIDKLQKGFIQMGTAIASYVTPAIDEMINAIARGENAFQAFGQAVVNILQAVISKLIQAAILAAIISAISGGAANADKGGLSFIQAFKNVFGGFRAAGGPVGAGSSYVVGERGPEIFVPNTGGTIVPMTQGGISAGGFGGGGVIMLRLAGNDLIAAVTLNQLRQGRL